MKKLITFILILIYFSSCTSDNNLPSNIIEEGNHPMLIDKTEVISVNSIQEVRYIYHVSNSYGLEWSFISFDKFFIGDTIIISKK